MNISKKLSTTTVEDIASLYLGIGRMLLIGPRMDSEMHHHFTIQIIITKQYPLLIRFENEDWKKTHAVIINSNVPHQMKGFKGFHVSFQIVPEGLRGEYLQNIVLEGENKKFLTHLDFSLYLDKFQECVEKSWDCAKAFQICENMVDFLSGVKIPIDQIDERIIHIMDRIQENLFDHISAKKLAETIFLSEDRFLHFFKEQLGLPLRQYILYQRMMTATKEFLIGKSLTEAAYEAGFSDSPHFTRKFIEMNGIKPSIVAKLKETYRIFICTSARCFRHNRSENKCSKCQFFHYISPHKNYSIDK